MKRRSFLKGLLAVSVLPLLPPLPQKDTGLYVKPGVYVREVDYSCYVARSDMTFNQNLLVDPNAEFNIDDRTKEVLRNAGWEDDGEVLTQIQQRNS